VVGSKEMESIPYQGWDIEEKGSSTLAAGIKMEERLSQSQLDWKTLVSPTGEKEKTKGSSSRTVPARVKKKKDRADESPSSSSPGGEGLKNGECVWGSLAALERHCETGREMVEGVSPQAPRSSAS